MCGVDNDWITDWPVYGVGVTVIAQTDWLVYGIDCDCTNGLASVRSV